MVKNMIGGKKGKMMAKKQVSRNDMSFPSVANEHELFVCVTKIFGGGVFQVVDHLNRPYKAFLRGKMKGSNKRHNLISMYSILLAAFRIDISDKSIIDILFVYDNHHILSLSLLPIFPLQQIIHFHHHHSFHSIHNTEDIFQNHFTHTQNGGNDEITMIQNCSHGVYKLKEENEKKDDIDFYNI